MPLWKPSTLLSASHLPVLTLKHPTRIPSSEHSGPLSLYVAKPQPFLLSISMLIPPELLLVLTSHLTPRGPHTSFPPLFEVPVGYTLDRLTAHPVPPSFSMWERPSPTPQRPLRRAGPAISSSPKFGHSPGRLSPVSPRALPRAPAIAFHAAEDVPEIVLSDARSRTPPVEVVSLPLPSKDTMPVSPPSRDDVHTPAPVFDAPPPLTTSRPSTPAFRLGNLFLSSCPGKKGWYAFNLSLNVIC